MTIFYHPRFQKSFKDLPFDVRQKAERKESIFRANPKDGRLKTHKLHGELRDFWSFSVDVKYRIIFEFDGDDITFLDIGDHDIYN
ncbi:hypothetical protein A2926_01345 [Candidatus Giovannonibacteria bacterium RIFCSPLOWO2_01_FULL_44_40]|uniref:Toxin YoeB n=1 Tax=Candidatus Giovannonibacteria bacterium RIFCSPHIGHO2_01_FULL_45_23 TaxID=1798325 RepID=A0A1F5VI33_9BACT|nr:MAG: hypothetical protein A2834_00660 [Candidatus Giovannonibacteria bacterium RIFCSPHIGHO2_01_FULL_45_23]OGF75859.1 MAG: hypothetical protein A3C77_02070 [Candidatus Giovannonibacteria bacterium RIFCSPHIGHO2_02_FULL_45_13]OGF79645.1 MAG: hypothetical protein A2926_01345 [Candidatus Giovannonibacteria bacterium RIFCSPLOWO2_01_FULL_44_40]